MLGGFKCTRNFLLALNLFYISVGILLISLGAHWLMPNRTSSLPIIGGVIACGVFLLVVSLGGIFATLKHHQVLLFFYMLILFCLFIIQFSVACACLAVSKDAQGSLALEGWRSVNFHIKDSIQQRFQCCGFAKGDRGKTMENDTMAHPSCLDVDKCVHASCGPHGTKDCCTGGDTRCMCPPCQDELESAIGSAFRNTGGVSLFFSFTEFIGIWLTVRYRNQKNPNFNGNPSAFL